MANYRNINENISVQYLLGLCCLLSYLQFFVACFYSLFKELHQIHHLFNMQTQSISADIMHAFKASLKVLHWFCPYTIGL